MCGGSFGHSPRLTVASALKTVSFVSFLIHAYQLYFACSEVLRSDPAINRHAIVRVAEYISKTLWGRS
jgi:hypothetical protein